MPNTQNIAGSVDSVDRMVSVESIESIASIEGKVREINGCTPDNISQEVLTSTQPLILKGLVGQWPIVQSGQQSNAQAVEYIQQFYQGLPVPVSIGAPEIEGRIFYNEDFTGFNYAAKKVHLGSFLNEILAVAEQPKPPTLYVSSSVIDSFLPGLRGANDLALNELNPRVSIWIGNKNRIAAHYDLPNNIACSVVGRRRFTFFPPEQLQNLYPGPLTFAPGGQSISLVDFYAPDFEKFPRFRNALASAQVAELEPGDAVFIPSMWWHHVESLDKLNVLINYWWREAPAFMGPPINVLHHALLTLRDLPPEQRQAWKNIFNHYIFDADESTNAHIPEQALGFLGELDDTAARKLRALLLAQLNR